MATFKKNEAVKALSAMMAKEKKHDEQTRIEYDIALQTNSERGHVFNQEEIKRLYDRWGQFRGASKCCHVVCHNGERFKYIVVKRARKGCWNPRGEGSGNQLLDEANFWRMFADKPESDYLCPTLKVFTSKSDKVEANSETMNDNIILISQRAIEVCVLSEACEKAEKLNREEGYVGTSARMRQVALMNFAKQMGWRDVQCNGGNSGVIFDYEKHCYKAVFVDYAL